jgi:hypothetical protein
MLINCNFKELDEGFPRIFSCCLESIQKQIIFALKLSSSGASIWGAYYYSSV